MEITPEKITKSNNKKQLEIKWKDHHEVFYDAVQYWIGPIPTAAAIKTLIRSDDIKIILETLPASYNQKILEYSFNELFPILKNKFENSDTIQFGPIALNNSNLSINNKEYKITGLKEIKANNGFCIFNLDGKIFNTKIRIKDIPNFNCMYKLLINDGLIIDTIGNDSYKTNKQMHI